MNQWRPVSIGGLVFAIVFTGFIAYRAFFADGWVPLVDNASFAVHEAGHPLFGIFSGGFFVYGGTLAQLLFPAICMFEFALHDWNAILSRWGLLNHDTTISNGLRGLTWLAIGCALGFLVLRWRQGDRRA
jgi:hypothetical protein